MTRYTRLVVAGLLAALCGTALDAQLVFRKKPAGAPANRVTITGPTTSETFEAAETPMLLGGTAVGAAIASIEWSNDRGGSGVAAGVGIWSVAASAGSETILSDAVTCASTTAITSITPQTGTGYTEAVDSVGDNIVNCRTSGYYQPGSPPTASAGAVMIYTVVDSPASTDFDMSFTLAAVGGSVTAGSFITRYSDADNYCGVQIYNPGRTPDVVVFRKVAGVVTTMDTADVSPFTGDVLLLENRGDTLTVKQNGNTVASGTHAFCDDNATVGFGWGAVAGEGASVSFSTNTRLDNLTVVDNGGTQAGVELQTGTNVITVTAQNAMGSTVATDTLTVTYGAVDATNPVLAIEQPTASPTYTTATAAITLSGSASDNVAVTSVTWACTDQTCTADSGTATGTAQWSFSTTVPCSAAPGTASTIQVTAHDAATNTAADALVVTCVSADTTAPTITITTDCGGGAGANCTITSVPQALAGTAADEAGGSGVASVRCDCPTCTPNSVNATGLGSWSLSLNPANGDNVMTCHALDAAGNDGTDTITITFTQSLVIVNATPLPPVVEDVAMTAQDITGTGGSGTYAWDNNGGGTTLNDGDAQCAGLSGADTTASPTDVYRISGTPTTTGTCSFTVRLDDGVATAITKAYTIDVVAAATGGYDFFDANVLRDEYKLGASYNPQGGVTCTTTFMGKSFASGSTSSSTCNPYFSTQVTTYGGTLDADQLAMGYVAPVFDATRNALKFTIPSYTTLLNVSLATNLGSAAGDTEMEISTTIGDAGVQFWWTNNSQDFKIDTEIVRCNWLLDYDPARPGVTTCWKPNGTGRYLIRIARGEHNTTRAAHTAPATIKIAQSNYFPQLHLPFGATGLAEGHTYTFIWDVLYTESYLGIESGGGQKSFQIGLEDDSLAFETKHIYSSGAQPGPSGGVAACTGYTSIHEFVGAWGFRSYNQQLYDGSSAFTDTNGGMFGPGVVKGNGLQPQTGTFCIRPNVWNRLWVRLDKRVDDWDRFSVWAADENRNPVLLLNELQIGDWNTFYGHWRMPEYNDTGADSGNGGHWVGSFPSYDPFRNLTSFIRAPHVMMDLASSEFDTPGSNILTKPLP